MIYRDPKCVYVTVSGSLAAVIQAFLDDQNIETIVMDEKALGGLEGATWTGADTQRGLEVWVKNSDDIERAKAAIAEREAAMAERITIRDARTGTVDAKCESCGTVTPFPMADAGKVENCPKCRSYMDIPDPDENADDEFWKATEEDELPEGTEV